MKDLMIDLETLGVTPRAVVLSIGACFFDPKAGVIGECFYAKLSIRQQMDREINPDTLKWWMSQSDAAKKVFCEDEEHPYNSLRNLKSFISDFSDPTEVLVWGNGACFDISIIENLYQEYTTPVPWKFSNVMDLRTFRRFVADNAKIPRSLGTHHNALDDAKNQALFVINAMKDTK